MDRDCPLTPDPRVWVKAKDQLNALYYYGDDNGTYRSHYRRPPQMVVKVKGEAE